jgi:hypothetical protein
MYINCKSWGGVEKHGCASIVIYYADSERATLRPRLSISTPEWVAASFKIFPNLETMDLWNPTPTDWTADTIPPGAGSRLTFLRIELSPSRFELPQFECLTRLKGLTLISKGDTEEESEEESEEEEEIEITSENPRQLEGLDILSRSVLLAGCPENPTEM